MPDLSGLERTALCFDDPLRTFSESVLSAGGRVVSALPEPVADQFCVEGEFGVAENGAVWIERIPDGASRRDLFIHDRLVVVLDKTQIVNNMHEAYGRLGESAVGYGIFMSGPSKTADIEQALVFGAHGPKELVIVLE